MQVTAQILSKCEIFIVLLVKFPLENMLKNQGPTKSNDNATCLYQFIDVIYPGSYHTRTLIYLAQHYSYLVKKIAQKPQ